MIGRRTEKEQQEFEKKVREHYAHAVKKHPVFVNTMLFRQTYSHDIRYALTHARHYLELSTRRGMRTIQDVLECEICEMYYEIIKFNKNRAIEEAYDCIAVLERIIDVLEYKESFHKDENIAK